MNDIADAWLDKANYVLDKLHSLKPRSDRWLKAPEPDVHANTDLKAQICRAMMSNTAGKVLVRRPSKLLKHIDAFMELSLSPSGDHSWKFQFKLA